MEKHQASKESVSAARRDLHVVESLAVRKTRLPLRYVVPKAARRATLPSPKQRKKRMRSMQAAERREQKKQRRK